MKLKNVSYSFLMVTILIGNIHTVQESYYWGEFRSTTPVDETLYGLFSYGLGDNSVNAKKSYYHLMPEVCNQNNCYVPTFSKDSLISSIFQSWSYVNDLSDVWYKLLYNKNFIAIGHSRGAEMLIHFIADCDPDNLKALVLIAAPVSVGFAFKGKIVGDPVAVPAKTLASIKDIKNKQLPVILLHQQNDKLVTVEHSHCLFKEFKAQGFKNVSLVIMQSGGHNDLLDKKGYQALQQFYKKNGLVV